MKDNQKQPKRRIPTAVYVTAIVILTYGWLLSAHKHSRTNAIMWRTFQQSQEYLQRGDAEGLQRELARCQDRLKKTRSAYGAMVGFLGPDESPAQEDQLGDLGPVASEGAAANLRSDHLARSTAPYKVNKSFFGVFLGEPTSALAERGSSKVHSRDWYAGQGDEDDPSKVWSIKGALDGSQAVQYTEVGVYKGRVMGVRVGFADSSSTNYEVIENIVIKRYGGDKPHTVTGGVEECSLITEIDGQDVIVQTKRFYRYGTHEVQVYYLHSGLFRELQEEIARKKATRIGEGL